MATFVYNPQFFEIMDFLWKLEETSTNDVLWQKAESKGQSIKVPNQEQSDFAT